MNAVRLYSLLLLFIVMIQARSASVITPQEHQRSPDQTYLTFPEWFLVHSPAEYAQFVATRPPHLFTYWGHIHQFWESYHAVADEVAGRYPPNYGYHVMVMVIGTSTTVEYGVKSTYEKLVGRVSALTGTYASTKEDQLAAIVAQDYVDFIRVDPWYKYDFYQRLKEVWTTTGYWGDDPIRKWERKYALTSEYAAKALYAWLIGKATKAGYEPPLPVTAVIVSGATETAYQREAVAPIAPADKQQDPVLLLLPRYQAFTTAAVHLAIAGVSFHEIAGNREDILVSVIARNGTLEQLHHATVLLHQPLLTQPPAQRYLLRVPIDQLALHLRGLSADQVEIEHIYDF